MATLSSSSLTISEGAIASPTTMPSASEHDVGNNNINNININNIDNPETSSPLHQPTVAWTEDSSLSLSLSSAVVSCVAVSPQGTWIATAVDPSVFVRRASSPADAVVYRLRLAQKLVRHSPSSSSSGWGRLCSLAWCRSSPDKDDETRLASGWSDGRVGIWHVPNEICLQLVVAPRCQFSRFRYERVHVSLDWWGPWLVAGTFRGDVCLWNTTTARGQPNMSRTAATAVVGATKTSTTHNNSLLQARVWKHVPDAELPVSTRRRNHIAVYPIVVRMSSAYLASAGSVSGPCQQKVILWSTRTWKAVHSVVLLRDPVTALAWKPDGTQLAVASLFWNTSVWAVPARDNHNNKGGECLFVLHEGQPGAPGDNLNPHSTICSVGCVAWSPDGRWLATGTEEAATPNHGSTTTITATTNTATTNRGTAHIKIWHAATRTCRLTLRTSPHNNNNSTTMSRTTGSSTSGMTTTPQIAWNPRHGDWLVSVSPQDRTTLHQWHGVGYLVLQESLIDLAQDAMAALTRSSSCNTQQQKPNRRRLYATKEDQLPSLESVERTARMLLAWLHEKWGQKPPPLLTDDSVVTTPPSAPPSPEACATTTTTT